MVDDSRTVIDALSVILKFQLDWIYNFGDTAIFRFWRFGWSGIDLFTWLLLPRMNRISTESTSGVEIDQIV